MNEKMWILSLFLAAAGAAMACMDVVNAFVLLPTPPRQAAARQQPSLFFQSHNYSPSARRTARTTKTSTRLFSATSLPDIATMKAGEMRQELESYGISTKSFFEKKEFMAALEKARAEGKTPKQQQQQQPSETKSKSTSSTSGTKDSTSSSSSSSSSLRDEKMKAEMDKAQKMSVGDLRTKLKELGIRTTTFFEKSEFVRAYAEAMVDGVKSSSTGAAPQQEEEPHDASYRDVVMQKMNTRDPRLLQGTIIDIKAASSSTSKR